MKMYYHLRSTVKLERFFGHVYFSNEMVFPNNRDDWTNEDVSFGVQNYEYLFHSCLDFCNTPQETVKIENIIENRPTFLYPVP